MLPTALAHGMGVLVYRALAAGWLTGRVRRVAAVEDTPRTRPKPDGYFDPTRNKRRLGAVEEVARDVGLSMIHLALAFVVEHPAVSSALLGARTTARLDSQLAAADMRLDDEVLEAIDRIVTPGTTIADVDDHYAGAVSGDRD